MAENQPPDRREIVTADRVRHTAREHEARPAWKAITSRKRELRVGHLRRCPNRRTGVIPLKLRESRLLAEPYAAKEIFGLLFQVIEPGTDGQVTIGHGVAGLKPCATDTFQILDFRF
jgi:hypothetical protein